MLKKKKFNKKGKLVPSGMKSLFGQKNQVYLIFAINIVPFYSLCVPLRTPETSIIFNMMFIRALR